MKKIILKTIAILLIVAGAMACKKEKDDKIIIGKIIGYHKCSDVESDNGFVFGICIIAEQNDSLIAYNIPHSILNSLLDLDINDLKQGGFFLNREIPLITFDYREAEGHEIITIICQQPILLIEPTLPIDDFVQVIITNINNEEIR